MSNMRILALACWVSWTIQECSSAGQRPYPNENSNQNNVKSVSTKNTETQENSIDAVHDVRLETVMTKASKRDTEESVKAARTKKITDAVMGDMNDLRTSLVNVVAKDFELVDDHLDEEKSKWVVSLKPKRTGYYLIHHIVGKQPSHITEYKFQVGKKGLARRILVDKKGVVIGMSTTLNQGDNVVIPFSVESTISHHKFRMQYSLKKVSNDTNKTIIDGEESCQYSSTRRVQNKAPAEIGNIKVLYVARHHGSRERGGDIKAIYKYVSFNVKRRGEYNLQFVGTDIDAITVPLIVTPQKKPIGILIHGKDIEINREEVSVQDYGVQVLELHPGDSIYVNFDIAYIHADPWSDEKCISEHFNKITIHKKPFVMPSKQSL